MIGDVAGCDESPREYSGIWDLLAAFSAVLGAALFTAVDTEGVEGSTDDVVTDAGEVANAAAADEDDGVFLEVVLFAGDIGGDFAAIGESDAGDFPEGGVGFFRGHGLDLEADAAFLRAGLDVFDLVDASEGSAGLFDQLIDGWHSVP